MKDYNYYRATGYPEKPKQPRMGTLSAGNARIYADAMDQYEKDMIVYRQEQTAYNERQTALHEEFKHDLIEENGLASNPKVELLFSKAWEHGHSAGYQEVAYWFNDLAELVL